MIEVYKAPEQVGVLLGLASAIMFYIAAAVESTFQCDAGLSELLEELVGDSVED